MPNLSLPEAISGVRPAVAFSAAAGAFALYAATKVYGMKAWKVDDVPEPPGYHWYWGHLPVLRKNFGRLLDWLADCIDEHADERGVIQIRNVGRGPFLIITEPRDLEFFFSSAFDNFRKNFPGVPRLSREILGHGIFGVDGAEWRRQRKLYSYTFSKKNLREHMYSTFEEITDKLIKKIDTYVASGETFDLQNLFARLTIEGICSIAFGSDLDCIEADETPAFVHAFDTTQQLSVDRNQDPLWTLKRFLNVGEREQSMKREMKEVDKFCYGMIERIRRGEVDPKKFNIVQLALQRAEQSGATLTNEELKDIALSFVIAGRDTTACAMTWICYELCRNPNIHVKVMEEIDSYGANLDFPTIEKEMPYLRAVFLESLRLHPSVPLDYKVCAKECTLPSGVKVPTGALVCFHPYIMGRNKRVYGEDCRQFRPERFVEIDKEWDEFSYPVFNAGPRLCLGKEMATLESKYVLSRLLQRYTFEIDESAHPAGEYIISIILWMKNGLNVKAKRREPDASL